MATSIPETELTSIGSVLSPSLITSYVTQGVCHPLGIKHEKSFFPFHQFPNRLAAEVYLIMDPDMLDWDGVLNSGSRVDPFFTLDFFASLRDVDIDAIARRTFDSFDSQNIKICAIATFLPEIGCFEPILSQTATRAVANVLRISAEIGRISKTTSPIVEVVCGSVSTFVDSVNGKLAMPLQASYRNGLQAVIENFGNALSEANRYCEPPKLALELEPGPLFWLQDLRCLRIAAKHIEKSQNQLVRENLLFNFDLAHWWIAGVDFLKEIDNPRSNGVISRIGHVHVSGHFKNGHFGDFSLGRLGAHEESIFVSWLTAIANNLSRFSPHFSGYVSVEFEAAFSADEAASSVKKLIDWLDQSHITPVT